MGYKKPLLFLTHEGKPHIFSGYGIPIEYGEKSPLVGMLMVDRPVRCPEGYFQNLNDTFGEVMVGPMTTNGDRRIFAQMRIENPLSLPLLRDDLYGQQAGDIGRVLQLTLNTGYLPKPRLKLHWSREYQLWVSEFDI